MTRQHEENKQNQTIRVPVPYENPEFLNQLHELYAAMREKYGHDDNLSVFHGTWSAGPWAELFLPQESLKQTMPPDFTIEKAQKGFVEQLDVLIDEICSKGYVGELAFSGKYPQQYEVDLTHGIIDRAVERLGRRKPVPLFQLQWLGGEQAGPRHGFVGA